MLIKEELAYRQLITLEDGTRVLLRTLIPEHRQALINLYASITTDDRHFVRHDVGDSKVVEAWVDELNYDKVLPLVAMIGERIVGNATLHFNEGAGRHRAEIRIYLAKDFRRRGLGHKMLQTLIDLARRHNIYLVEAQVVAGQSHVLKTLHKLGFEAKCTLEDYFIAPDGELLDVVHAILRLRADSGEF